jgi:hypothetical protein
MELSLGVNEIVGPFELDVQHLGRRDGLCRSHPLG